MEIDNVLDVKSSERSIVYNEPNGKKIIMKNDYLKKNNLNKSAILLSQKENINNSNLKEEDLHSDILVIKVTSKKSILKSIPNQKKGKILPLFDLNNIKNFSVDSSISRQSKKSEENEKSQENKEIIKKQIEENEENEKSKENKDNIVNRQIEDNLESKEIRRSNEYCLICYKKLTYKEYCDNNRICKHFFCDDCYYLYLKEKINNNYNIDKIICPKDSCDLLMGDNFIEKKLINDIPL